MRSRFDFSHAPLQDPGLCHDAVTEVVTKIVRRRP
jgi:hypothetical protein